MTAALSPLRRLARTAARRLATTIVSAALALAAASAASPGLAAPLPALRGDVVAKGDVLTLADLVDGLSGTAAERPAFRAPALGATGTIQARRIVEAARNLGLGAVETGGRTQIVVARATRRIGTAEIEAAVRGVVAKQYGLDAGTVSIAFDGTPPSLAVEPDVTGAVAAEDVTFDRRSRRVSALVSVGSQPGDRRASVRVTGALVEVVAVAVLNRLVARGDTVQAGDFTVERRVREGVPADAQPDVSGLAGQVAKRSLVAGSVVRTGDFAKPEIVSRGDIVTVLYEVPGMTLTLRGRASESGAQGDVIAVLNPQSKRTLQAQIVGPGRVSVSAVLPSRVASNPLPVQP